MTKATAIGCTAILMWSLLAILTIGSAPTPPFLLAAISFSIGGALGLIWTLRQQRLAVLGKVGWRVYAAGTLGLFGYHALYFTAFRLGPTAETGLIAYLWPLFIVLLSGLLPGEQLRSRHVLGTLLAFAGAALIVLGPQSDTADRSLAALGLAFCCALTWSAYSVLSRRFGTVPTEAVTVFCLGSAALSAIAHLISEPTLWPTGAMPWACVIALGLGPVGAAFFTWDIGMKKGDIQLLGVAAYAAPLLSTVVLVVAGVTQPTYAIGIAAVLITTGAALAASANGRPRSD